MTEDASKNWFQTLPGIFTSLTALLTALAGFFTAINFWFPRDDASRVVAKAEQCIPGYVRREATPDDNVCITVKVHEQTLQATCSPVRGVIQRAVLMARTHACRSMFGETFSMATMYALLLKRARRSLRTIEMVPAASRIELEIPIETAAS
jgi:hypothetical protein